MIWVVSKYEAEGDEYLVEEWVLSDTDSLVLPDAFADTGLGLTNEVTEKQRGAVERLIGAPVDLEGYAYFVELFSDDGANETIEVGGEVIYLPPRSLPAFPDARRASPREASD